ncbi:MAG: N-6 DNA methylase [Riemerella sp.]|jgi:hypothetical protein|nr:N-6 DNA methylase [Riemerella sp.]
MELTKERKHKTGAYYTPKEWANLAVEYLKKTLNKPIEKYVFYDPAAGEGALLEALPEGCEKYGTTLEAEDVEILRSKGIPAWQFDFLNDKNINHLPHALFEAAQLRRLIIFTNPPYIKVTTGHARETYPTNDAVQLFYYRCAYELNASVIAGFNKMDIWQASSGSIFRENMGIYYNAKALFITPSMSWEGLKGKFPIAFNILDYGVDGGMKKLCYNDYTLEEKEKIEFKNGLYRHVSGEKKMTDKEMDNFFTEHVWKRIHGEGMTIIADVIE